MPPPLSIYAQLTGAGPGQREPAWLADRDSLRLASVTGRVPAAGSGKVVRLPAASCAFEGAHLASEQAGFGRFCRYDRERG